MGEAFGVHFTRSPVHPSFSPRSVDTHLYRVFPLVVNEGNGLIMLLDAVNRYMHFIVTRPRLFNGNVVDRFAIPVVHFKPVPIRRKARCKTQFVDFESESQK